MHVGKIIKFYREQARMTQEQLGKGICSDTHISKIERGSTDFSPEVIALLTERLNICLDNELIKLNTIKKRLFAWHEAIVMLLLDEMETIKLELENEQLIQISDYTALYQLIQARYYLVHSQSDPAYAIVLKMQRSHSKLPTYESNLLLHITGICYLARQDYRSAIDTLKQIDDEEYNNPEYYYHMAVAYHWIGSHMMAYYYGEKSLRFFKDSRNFVRTIDAEMLLLLQVVFDENRNQADIIVRFENLIKSCDICNTPERKRIALHNLAYEYLEQNNYELAANNYQASMALNNPKTMLYLLSLEGYIRCSLQGKLLSKEELLRVTEGGLRSAKEIHDHMLQIRFQLLLYKIEEQHEQYYSYLRNSALSVIRNHGDAMLVEKCEKELFNYYLSTGQQELALETASFLINKGKSPLNKKEMLPG
ncbi:helix-turn-helix domain-containing protein [Paenibacillus sp. CF384]|uniref:helix-turn-helix domain-containing protein n=1 Tax=Paenibacillus sp. CF384 TaxID=1884382 RepID=UPI0008947D61|nr:helix-turn-helix transcriptional regulator [Paenibacillus sp. CF384]SDW90238.1 Helix-turn-helix [Paenibacillus sp. CF384]